MIKGIKPIAFEKENQLSTFLKKTRVQQRTPFSAVLFKYDITD